MILEPSSTTPTYTAHGLFTVSGLNILPSTQSTHMRYTFYISPSLATGRTTELFGPYYLDVGCTPFSASFSDNPALVVIVDIFVGDSTTGVYTFALPSSSRTYCTIVTTSI